MNKNPLSIFFKLGDKVTGGDPKRKADFDYYMMWIMFTAFSFILLSNFINFAGLVRIDFWSSLKYLGWSLVMLAILWFQYFSLKMIYQSRKMMKDNPIKVEKIPEIKEFVEDSVEDMMNQFEDKK